MKLRSLQGTDIYSNFKKEVTDAKTTYGISEAIIDLRSNIIKSNEPIEELVMGSVDYVLQKILSENGIIESNIYNSIISGSDVDLNLFKDQDSLNQGDGRYDKLHTMLDSNEAILEAMALFQKDKEMQYNRTGEDLTERQRNFLGAFLDNAVGNAALNSKLSELANNKSVYFNLNFKEEIDGLKRFSYKSRVLDDVLEQGDKVDSLGVIGKNSTIPYSKRFTLEEFGKLSDLHAAYSSISRFSASCGDTDAFNKLSNVLKIGESAGHFLQHIEEEFMIHATNDYKAGDIVMYDIDKRAMVTNNKPNRESELIKKYITNYGHAATVAVEGGKAKLSHVYGEYEVDDFDMRKGIFSDTYRIDLSALLTKEAAQAAQKLYGDQWKERVNEVYQDVSSQSFELSQKDRVYNGIINSSDKRFKAGIASYVPLGHKSLKATDWESMREQFNDPSKTAKEMICSEFASRLAIVTFMESNEKLQEMLGVKDKVLNIPFSRHEDLNKVNPGRLMDILNRAGCIEEVPPSGMQIQIFKRPEEDMRKITSEICRQFKDGISRGIDAEEICVNLVNTFEREHNKRFPNDQLKLDASTKDMMVILIKGEVDNIQKQVQDTQNAHNEGKKNSIFAKIYNATCNIVGKLYRKLDQHIDQNIVKETVNIIDKFVEGAEKHGSWVNRFHNNVQRVGADGVGVR